MAPRGGVVALQVADDGTCASHRISASVLKRSFLHDAFDGVEIRSASMPVEALLDAHNVHSFAFPPPLNRYLVPRDCFILRSDGTDMVFDDLQRLCDSAVLSKKPIQAEAYNKRLATDGADGEDEEFLEDEEVDDEVDEEAEDEEEEDDIDDDEEWDEEDTKNFVEADA